MENTTHTTIYAFLLTILSLIAPGWFSITIKRLYENNSNIRLWANMPDNQNWPKRNRIYNFIQFIFCSAILVITLTIGKHYLEDQTTTIFLWVYAFLWTVTVPDLLELLNKRVLGKRMWNTFLCIAFILASFVLLIASDLYSLGLKASLIALLLYGIAISIKLFPSFINKNH